MSHTPPYSINTDSVTHVIYLSEKTSAHVLGGVETQLFSVLPLLAKKIRVHLIVLIWHLGPQIKAALDNLELSAQQMGAVLQISRITRSSFSGTLQKTYASLVAFYQLWQHLIKDRSSVLNLHLDHFFVPIVAILASSKRIVFSFHNDEPFYRSLKYRTWFLFLRYRIKAFSAISQHVADYVAECLKISRQRITVVPYGISPLQSETSSPDKTAPQLQTSHSPPIVGFVGRLTAQKNIFLLLEAMLLLPDVKLQIIGGGPLRKSITAWISQNNVTNVQLLGPVSNGRDIINSFSLLCLPSKWEGLGLVLLEAMVQGVPVIGANNGAIPEVLDFGRVGLLFSDPQSCAAAISAVLADTRATSGRREAAKIWVAENYSIERAVTCYLDFYDSVISLS